MNSEDCIVISDEEEETPNIVGTHSNDKPQNDNSNRVCMPEFVSVPSPSLSNMVSECDYVTNPAKLASTGPTNFIEISKSDLKKSIRKNDLIIKIDGTLNPLNINAIMSVIKLYNFQNAGKFFFVKSSNPNEEIDVSDLICQETLSSVTTPDQENCIPQPSQKLNVICKANKVKAPTVANRKLRKVFPATTTCKNCEIEKDIDKPNEFHKKIKDKFSRVCRVKPVNELGTASCQNSETAVQHVHNDHPYQNNSSLHQNTQNMYNRIRVKPFDQIGISSHQNVEAALGRIDNDHANQNQININKSNGFSQNTQQSYCNSTGEIPFDQIGGTTHPILGHFDNNDHDNRNPLNINESTKIPQNTQKDCYKIRLKPLKELSKPSCQVAETAVSTDNGQFSYLTQNNSIENFHQEHDPNMGLLQVDQNKYRSINWNDNTEWNNNDELQYAPPPNNFNVFSVTTENNSVLQNDRTDCEPIQQNSCNLGRFSSVSNHNKLGVQIAVRKPKLRMKNRLQTFYEKKYKLKEVRVAVSRLEVENYFAKERLKEDLSLPTEQSLPLINQIFIHDHNFASMTHYYCNEIPPNTRLYFVNKHNITTSLYMKNFPLFAKAIKTNKIQVISESTYKKCRPTTEDKLICLSNKSLNKKQKALKFCQFVSNFHHSLRIERNPLLKYIKLDHSYSVTMI